MHDLDRERALPAFLRDPQWRWKLALTLRANPTRNINEFRSDPQLHEAASFYRSMCVGPHNHNYRKARHPEMTIAYALWSGAQLSPVAGVYGRGGWRGIIEALLLTDVDPADFSTLLRVDIPADTIRLYTSNYFDVKPYLDSEPAVHINVLSAAEQNLSKHPAQPEMNCMLRLFAYTWGADALLSHFYSRSAGQSLTHQRWMRVLAGEVLTRQVAMDALSRRNMYKEEYVNLFKVAQKNWEMPGTDVDAVEDEIKKRFLHETVTVLGDRLARADKLRASNELTRAQALEAATRDGFTSLTTPSIEL